MRVPAPVWRHTTLFFVGQLLTLLCCGLLLVHWHYSFSPAVPPAPLRPTLAGQPPPVIAAEPGFWREARVVLQLFAGAALLILIGSSAMFAACELLRLQPPAGQR